ncbi:MAG: xanthosine triphosphate pyrophosphatase, partial [Oscillospiraceae bacterium]|nr:xanthosine triphosphate pyrophosphatase [Oscillospiraceae bacterium]
MSIELLYGTGNSAKLQSMREILKPLDIEIIGLSDMKEVPSVDESGSSPLENARIKALTYYHFYDIPVFSCDSGLFFDNPDFPAELQPGVNVRTVGGKRLSDEEMTAYYGGLAAKYGRLTARYKNAVCFVLSENIMAESMDDSLSGNPFYIVDKPHEKWRNQVEGFPLDCLSVHIPTGKYYYDLTEEDIRASSGLASSTSK